MVVYLSMTFSGAWKKWRPLLISKHQCICVKYGFERT